MFNAIASSPHSLFSGIASMAGAVTPPGAVVQSLPLMQQVLFAFAMSAIVIGVLFSAAGYIVLMERRIIAWLQHRVGPNRAGPFGILQPLADVLKLLTKEDATPPFADKFLFIIAPTIVVITGILSIAIIPFNDPAWDSWLGRLSAVSHSNVGALLFLGLSSLGVYSIVLAGWSSNSKYAILGGLRATAQMISYELSMSLALLAVVMMAGSLNVADIVRAQSPVPFIVLQPIGFVVFFIAIFAESRRTPFDLPEAENELVAGFHTEYSSMKFALFFLGEYIGMIVLSAMVVALYLGGWHGPGPDGFWWFLAKVLVLMFVFIWVRATFPRFRYDHLMDLGWKYLIPLAIINVIYTAILCLGFPNLIPNAIH